MRAEGIVREVLCDVEREIHRARFGAVCAAVTALIYGGQVGLAALGRTINRRSHKQQATVAHGKNVRRAPRS